MPSVVSTAAMAFALAASVVNAHMEMSFPPPLRSKFNPNAATVDSDMTSPLSSSGSNFPCKGYLSDLGSAGGKSVVTFAPGQKSNMTIVGGAAHNGGSCQASLSYDQGKTYKVIQSWIGECPVNGGSSFDFTIPDDAPAGDAVFAWTWNNKVGNPELYMNCASVTISGSPKNRVRGMQPRAAVPFAQRPAPFISNIGNGCKTENMVVDYPNPGPDVVRKGDAKAPTCDGGAGSGSGGGGATSTSAGPTSASVAPTTSAANPGIPTPSSAAPSVSTSASATLPGGVFLTATTPAASASASPSNNGTTASASATVTATTTTAASAAPPAATGGTVTGQQSGSCTDEGVYLCLGGTSFQRCASGIWSTPIAMAPGTSCTPGQSKTLFARAQRARAGPRRFDSPWAQA